MDPAKHGPEHDLLRQSVGNKVHKKLKRKQVRWLHGAPSCRSFSRARRPSARLRSRRFPLGLPEKLKHPLVTQGNAAARFMCKAALIQHRAGGYWSIEQPLASFFWDTPGARRLAKLPGAIRIEGDQCAFGAAWKKPTAWLTNGGFLKVLAKKCPGPPTHTKHDLLEGKVRNDSGELVWKTSLAAAYPKGLCREVARAYRPWAAEPFRPTTPIVIKNRTVYDALDPERTRKAAREKANQECIGGLRSAKESIEKIPKWTEAAAALTEILDQIVKENAETFEGILSTMGTEAAKDVPQEILDIAMERTLEKYELSEPAELFEHLRERAGDPETEVTQWLKGTAPMGILRPIKPTGVFPILSELERERAQRSYPDAVPERKGFTNYQCYEQNRDLADDQFDREVRKGYVETSFSRRTLEKTYGKIVPSKIAAIVKDTANGKKKTRLIHDMSRSGVNQKVTIRERVVLPRMTDVFASCLRLAATKAEREIIMLMVLDFADAFKHLKVAIEERRFLGGWTAKFGWFVYCVLFFGIVSGPLLWGRVAALIMRCTCALEPTKSNQHTYVDDPLVVVAGTRAECKAKFSKFILLWRLLGFNLSLPKGAFGQQVAWVGLHIRVDEHRIEATVDDMKREKLRITTEKFLNQKLIIRADLIVLSPGVSLTLVLPRMSVIAL